MEDFELVVADIRKRADLAESKGEVKLRKRLIYTANIFEELDSRNIDPKPFDSFLKTLKTLLSQSEIKPSQVTRFYSSLLKFLQKEYGLVTKNYYQTQWMVLGMTVFGVPFGMMFGFALDNFAFFGIGLPIGMPIGIAIGAAKDKKAKDDGLQLDVTYDF